MACGQCELSHWTCQRAVDRTSEMRELWQCFFLNLGISLFSRCERAGTVGHRLELNIARFVKVGGSLEKCSARPYSEASTCRTTGACTSK